MITNKKKYKQELLQIKSACEKYGGIVTKSNIAYEIARYNSDDGTIIFYQYRSSAGNYTIRQRISKIINSKIADVAIYLMLLENNTKFCIRNISPVCPRKQIRKALLNKK